MDLESISSNIFLPQISITAETLSLVIHVDGEGLESNIEIVIQIKDLRI